MRDFAWDTTLETGDAVVDEQHKELFAMVNELRHAIVTGRGREQALETMARLRAYTDEHFAAEEALMDSCGYPRCAAHRAQHRRLSERLGQLTEDYESGALKTALPLSDFLVKWLGDHIRRSDSDLVAYATARP